jgi:RNA polymerase sigma-32 factor
MQASAASLSTFEAGLSKYLAEIRRFPLLEPQEEYMLAKRWREHGDRAAAERLVTSHLRLVARIAAGYRGYGLPVAEVIAEGNVGLMQAVKRFDPAKGFRLTTYAIWWIRAAIQEYILRSWSMVKIGAGANQRRLFFKLRTAKSRIAALEEGDLRPDHVAQIAQQLDVPARDVVEMNRRLGGDVSLNVPVGPNGDAGERQDWLVDEAPSPERVLAQTQEHDSRRSALAAGLALLAPGREQRIFAARRLADEPITLEALAEEFAISRERVRQIETRAFAKVAKAVKSHLATRAPQPRASRTDDGRLALAF